MQDTAVLLQKEQQRLEAAEAASRAEAGSISRVLHLVEDCASGDAALDGDAPAGGGGGGRRGPPKSLDAVEAVYRSLAASYREEYVLYNLSAVALAQAMPRLAALLAGWAPLQEPTRGAAEFARWRPLLESEGTRGLLGGGGGEADDPYLTLAAELILPPLRSALTSWEPRLPEPLLGFLDVWEKLLPGPARAHVLDSLVMPRLRSAVAAWEPRQETVPIHTWLHPWLPLLGHALDELYPSIRHKLAVALQVGTAEATWATSVERQKGGGGGRCRQKPQRPRVWNGKREGGAGGRHAGAGGSLDVEPGNGSVSYAHPCARAGVAPQRWLCARAAGAVAPRVLRPRLGRADGQEHRAQAGGRACAARGQPGVPGHGAIRVGHRVG
eukprot:353259-Chlamydomonas_euryale.AAC.2